VLAADALSGAGLSGGKERVLGEMIDTPHGKGYPAHFPLIGLNENREWLRKLNDDIHERGIKVVGHINVKFLVGDPEYVDPKTNEKSPRGFFHFYRNLLDEKLLGPKPVADPLEQASYLWRFCAAALRLDPDPTHVQHEGGRR